MPRPLSPVPYIGEVTGEAAGHNEQSIDADVVAVAGKARRQPLGRHGDTPQPIFVERPGRGVDCAALLDLDKRQRPAATGNQVDLATRYARPLGENSPTSQPQPPGGDGFRLATTRLGKLAIQLLAPSSRARA